MPFYCSKYRKIMCLFWWRILNNLKNTPVIIFWILGCFHCDLRPGDFPSNSNRYLRQISCYIDSTTLLWTDYDVTTYIRVSLINYSSCISQIKLPKSAYSPSEPSSIPFWFSMPLYCYILLESLQKPLLLSNPFYHSNFRVILHVDCWYVRNWWMWDYYLFPN